LGLLTLGGIQRARAQVKGGVAAQAQPLHVVGARLQDDRRPAALPGVVERALHERRRVPALGSREADRRTLRRLVRAERGRRERHAHRGENGRAHLHVLRCHLLFLFGSSEFLMVGSSLVVSFTTE